MLEKVKGNVKRLNTTQTIVYSFALIILIGTLLLCLPASSKDNQSVGFIDALFTVTSALCVTGLSVVNTQAQWSIFGKFVILSLIQIGAVGIITVITMLYIFLGRKVTLNERLVVQESLNQKDIRGMVVLVKRVIIGTVIIETIGALLLTVIFIRQMNLTFFEALGMGFFHSVSAFGNAGFDIIGDNSLVPFANNIAFNLVIIVLIFLGGIGFLVWGDVIKNFNKAKETKQYSPKLFFRRLSLHSKIVIEVSFGIIAFSTLFFLCAEFNNPNTIGNLPFYQKLLQSLFQAVTPRTAGFYTIPQDQLTTSSQLMTMILMFIGGSPGSTAGGIKTATLGVIIIAVFSSVRGDEQIIAHGRAIPIAVVQKALAIIMLDLIVIICSTMILSISENHLLKEGFTIWEILFEVISAVSTSGLSLGITPYLSDFGKVIICICMFIGRLGPITVVVGLTERQLNRSMGIRYPEEVVIVG